MAMFRSTCSANQLWLKYRRYCRVSIVTSSVGRARRREVQRHPAESDVQSMRISIGFPVVRSDHVESCARRDAHELIAVAIVLEESLIPVAVDHLARATHLRVQAKHACGAQHPP